MCGISGIHHPGQGAADWRDAVRFMTAAMVHRGPDEEGFHEDPDVSLGVRRLRIIDLHGGAQPISNEDGTIHLVANCEIYDFERTRSRLEAAHAFRTRSDAEVILHLYEEHGLRLFEHVEGMYAFALWDRSRHRLVIGRDPFGIKPLFHTLPDVSGSFAFASEITPLLRLERTSTELDPLAIDDFFAFSYIPHPRTVYRSIRKLAPGSCIVAEAARFDIIEHWRPDLPPPPFPADEADKLAALDSAIGGAVRRSMRSDVPLGAFLSGGLDSGTVVYHMTRAAAGAVPTFALRYDDERCDEGPLARQTARMLGTDHHEILARPEDLLLMPGLSSPFGEPFADPSQIPAHLVCRAAQQEVRVLLSGDGGDELLGGYPAYCASLLARPLRALSSPLGAVLRAMPDLPSAAVPRLASAQARLRKFASGSPLRWDRRHAFWRTIMNPVDRGAIYSSDLRSAIATAAPHDDDGQPPFDATIDELTRCQFLDMRTYLTDNCLAKTDRMSMANSVEVRVPLLDRSVFQAAMRLPPDLRVSGLQTKVGLRRVMMDRLPDAVVRTGKRGFPVPLEHWFRGPLREHVERTLAPSRIRRIPWLCAAGVGAVVHGHSSGAVDNNRQLWSLLCFVHWHEGRTPSP